MIVRTIIAIDKPKLQKQLQKLISQHDVILDVIKGKTHLLERISRESNDLIIISQSLIPEPFLGTINLLRQLPDSPGVVVMSDRENSEDRAQFLAAGCDAVLYSGLSTMRLQGVIATIVERRSKILRDGLATRRILAQPRLTDFVSSSPAMQMFMNIVSRVVPSDVPLLVLGETGVGKERLARAIHSESSRSKGPFITVNCGALPETLLESELFGHEEGAFTGAVRSRRGWFELAHSGTIFLDEIGELPNHLQVKLLHVLQEHEITRVGSEKSFAVNVRVIAATNRDLEEEVASLRFRKDLYYRLSVVALTIPPLRNRREDIPVLIDSYINYLRSRIGRDVFGITHEALQALCRYSWPGNVRELINVIERAMLLCNDDKISLADLPESISGESELEHPQFSLSSITQEADFFSGEWLQKPLHEVRKDILERFEHTYLAGLLQLTGGRIGETAKRAGIQPRSLFDKMKRLGLRKEEFRIKKS